jgi:membrane-bound lytic murein transglycosylase MltF
VHLVNFRSKLSLMLCMVIALLAPIGCRSKEAAQKTTAPGANKENGSPVNGANASSAASTPAVAGPPAPFGRHTEDFDGMVKRRNIRALVILNPIGFFYSNGRPMGAVYEALRELEAELNQKLKTGTMKVNVTFIPVRVDQAELALTQGIGDFVANGVVITQERQQRLAFTVPIQKDVKQIVVSGAGFGTVSSLEELSGKVIYANPLTASYQSLVQLNEELKKKGKTTIDIKRADEHLLEDDLVQMVNAGLIPATVTNELRAKLWSQVLHNITVHPDLAVASGQQTAWVLRKNNPELKKVLDEFVAAHAAGTSFGNTLLRRYLENTKWVVNSTTPEEMKKFAALSVIFKKCAGQYDFDYLMIMAQGYQESLLEQDKRNPSGAVGIMQVIPKYAAASPINVPNVSTPENNVLAGVKMLRTIEDHYFNDPKIDPVDKTLMTFASYNAGPNRIARLRQQAASQGLDPDKWFNNVELMVAKDVGQETVTYVGNVYKYYIAYKLALETKKLETSDQAANLSPSASPNGN